MEVVVQSEMNIEHPPADHPQKSSDHEVEETLVDDYTQTERVVTESEMPEHGETP